MIIALHWKNVNIYTTYVYEYTYIYYTNVGYLSKKYTCNKYTKCSRRNDIGLSYILNH